MVYATADAATVKCVQNELGAARAGALVESALAEITSRLVDAGVRRLIVAGGETAGAVVNTLQVAGFRIGHEIDPGVPWTVTLGERPLALALKSGNFGTDDFFLESLEQTAVTETAMRDAIAEFGRSIFERGLTAGSSGNISVRLEDGWLLTPTNACLGRLDPARISKLDWKGRRSPAIRLRRKPRCTSPCTSRGQRPARWFICIPPIPLLSPACAACLPRTACRPHRVLRDEDR